ncbi:carbamoyl-phosphate synthase large subunit, partial [Aminipila sp.]|uniref:carbamoyl-phosphate synthase large subunit n=1 Tax=Aminipila sp. TaxID=2060095 RepID=UPI00289E3C55
LELTSIPREVLQDMRVYNDIYPVYKVVDTCGGEFDAVTPYYYSCYEGEDESKISQNKKILVIGSGPIRIGQGIEFDYCCVQGVWAIKDMEYEAILMNNNPETVSTDFDTSDKLYFESLHVDNVMNVIKKERPDGVVLQFGGQTSLNLAEQLHKRSIKILGTSFKSIDLAEDREKFIELLQELGIPTPEGRAVTDEESAFKTVAELGYPVVVRPSYVIGGRAMQVVYSDEELRKYFREAVSLTREHPVLIDKYIQGKEVEVDAIGDGENILIPGIMEHIERTGVHSGDSMTVYPPHTLEQSTIDTIIDYTERISKALHVIGLVNIQYAFDGKNVYVIEVNPRASRTVPILSKVTGVPMIKLAVSAMLGKKLKDFEYGTGLYKHVGKYAVKVPVFSGAKLTDVDVTLGPEMKSTGEVLGIDHELDKAIYKGFLAANIRIPVEGGAYFALRDTERTEHTLNVVKMYQTQGYKMYCSEWTYDYFIENGIDAVKLNFEDAKDMIGEEINLFINVPSIANRPEREDFILRRKAIERGLPVLTCMDTAEAFMTAVKLKKAETKLDYCVLNSR